MLPVRRAVVGDPRQAGIENRSVVRSRHREGKEKGLGVAHRRIVLELVLCSMSSDVGQT